MSKVLPLTGKPTPAGPASSFSPVGEILAELRAGRMVIVMDDEDRENEGDLIMAAEHATPEAVAFMIRHTSGIICVPMEEEQLARLELPQMVPVNSESHRTAFTVSVDLRAGTTTGVSSADRAATIRALADASSKPGDFARPGHIFPLRARRGGVLVRAGHTEAAVDLCHLAGLKPAGVLCEVMNEDGSMARRPQLQEFARRHALKIGTIADLIRHRLRTDRSVERLSEQSVQTELGEFRLYAYQDGVSQEVHVALTTAAWMAPRHLWCACTWRTPCATCSGCRARRVPGRCARPCSVSSKPAAGWSSCCVSRIRARARRCGALVRRHQCACCYGTGGRYRG